MKSRIFRSMSVRAVGIRDSGGTGAVTSPLAAREVHRNAPREIVSSNETRECTNVLKSPYDARKGPLLSEQDEHLEDARAVDRGGHRDAQRMDQLARPDTQLAGGGPGGLLEGVNLPIHGREAGAQPLQPL